MDSTVVVIAPLDNSKVATITPRVSEVDLSPGQTRQITATAQDANGATLNQAAFGWSSDDQTIATVDSNGNVTGVSPGTTYVEIRVGRVRATPSVRIVVAASSPSAVDILPDSVQLALGATRKLSASVTGGAANTVAWSSSNPSIARVDNTGNVTGVSAGGPVTITATAGAVSGTASVTVLSTPTINYISPTSVTASPNSFPLTINGSNFDPATAQIVVTGPGCATITTCVVHNNVLTTKNPAQIVGPVIISNPGTFTIQVQNGSAGTLSNGQTLTATLGTPTTINISPTSVTASPNSFPLTINGSNFDPATAQIVVTGPGCATITTCVVNNNVLTTKNPAQIVGPVIISNPGTFTIQVQNGSGATLSNGQTLTATLGTPTTINISPTSVTASPNSFPLTINGSNFDPATAQIVVTGPGCATITTCVVNNNVLTTKNPAQIVGPVIISNPGTFTIQVQNGSGATLSNGQTLTATLGTPTTINISPTSVTASPNSFPLTINGSNFDPATAQIVVTGPGCATITTCVVNNNVLTTKNPAQIVGPVIISNPGTFTIQVQNGSAGTLSNGQTLTATLGTPTTINISPTSVTASPNSFPLTINGSNFDPATAQIVVTGPGCATITTCVVHNNVLATKNPAQIVGPVIISNPGTFTIQVQNGSAGTLSNGQTLTATLGTPTTINISPTSVTASPNSFPLTINGSNFDPATAQIVVTGPGCPTTTSCVVPNGVLTTKNSGQVVGPVTISNAGTFTIQVQNGSAGTLSNGQTLTATLGTPTTTNISPTSVTASPNSFPLTINGSNFNPATVQIVVTGPSCPTTTSCVVSNGVLTTKNSGQVVGPVTISNAGTFTIQVQNGSAGTLSNGQTLTATAAIHPVAAISPTSGKFNVTTFTRTDTGFTPNGGITQNVTYPNGGLTVLHQMADGNGNYSNSFVLGAQAGNYSAYDVDDVTGSGSNTITWTVTPNPQGTVNPTTGTVNSTQYTINGSGATENGIVTNNETYPDGSPHPYTVTADGFGNFTFGPFQASQAGNYRSVITDNASGAQSNAITWSAH